MSNSLLSLYEREEADVDLGQKPFSNILSREQSFQRISESPAFDLVVIGGGLTSALTAHYAALSGIRVLLLNEEYFGSNPSLWSIAYARALQSSLADRLSSALSVRASARNMPEHLQRSFALKDSSLLDRVFARVCDPVSPKVSRHSFANLPWVDERRLIRETVLAARQEGALCLSTIKLLHVDAESESGCYLIEFKDRGSESALEVRAGCVLFDSTLAESPRTRLGTRIGPLIADLAIFRRYICQVENMKSAQCGLLKLVASDKGVLIARELSAEIIELVVEDRPDQALQNDEGILVKNLCDRAGYSFRDLISSKFFIQRNSRRCAVKQHGGILLSDERGPWDSARCAQEVILKLCVASHGQIVIADGITERPLPGSDRGSDVKDFRDRALSSGLSDDLINQVVSRWGGRVRYLNDLEPVCPLVLRGELELAFLSDQVCELDDLIFGSLSLESSPGWREMVAPIVKEYALVSGFDLTA